MEHLFPHWLIIICIACSLLVMFLEVRDRIYCVPASSPVNSGQVYWFKFQQHPFDDFHRFHVCAKSQEEADGLARQQMTELFESCRTVMKTFFRA